MMSPGVVDWSMSWMKVKLVGVLLLLGAHGAMEGWTKKFAAGANTKSSRFYRIVNELPAVIMVVIVAMVIAKPF
jgi:putative membrane protein